MGELAEGRSPCRVAVAAAFGPADVALEAFKKICPVAGPDDEHVAAVVLVFALALGLTYGWKSKLATPAVLALGAALGALLLR